jgi:hypothetical protein
MDGAGRGFYFRRLGRVESSFTDPPVPPEPCCCCCCRVEPGWLLLLLCCTYLNTKNTKDTKDIKNNKNTKHTVNWLLKKRRFEFESLKDFLYFRNRCFHKHPQIHFLRVFGWRLLMALRSVALVCDANVV